MYQLFEYIIPENFEFYNINIFIFLLFSLLISSKGLKAKLCDNNTSTKIKNSFSSHYSHWYNIDLASESPYNYFREKQNNFNITDNFSYTLSNNSGISKNYYYPIFTKIDSTYDSEKPPLSSLRIGGEFVTGVGSGIIIGGGSGFLGYSIAMANGAPVEFGSIAYFGLGFIIGYPIGNTIGVYLIGNIGDETGDFWNTLFGSIIGSVGGVFLRMSGSTFLPYMILAPLGATIGFNLSRRYDQSIKSNAFLNYEENKLTINFPKYYYRYTRKNRACITINIIQFNF
mgnify:CR=1 FL=1